MSKKLLSLLLSILMFMSAFGTMSVLANDDETEILGPGVGENTLPEIAEGCNRYFFYLPKYWENEYTQTAGIFWFEGTGAHDSWPGVEANKADAEDVYYYDVPKDVDQVIWNNYFDGGNDMTSDEYYAVRRSDDAVMYGYEPGEHELYPDGIYDYNNMIFIIDFNDCGCLDWNERTFGGNWYYYYGNGEYGTTPEKGEVVYTDRSIGEYCPHQRPADSGTLPELKEGYNRYFFYMPDSWGVEDGKGMTVTYGRNSVTGLEYADVKDVYICDLPEDTKEFYIVSADRKACSTYPKAISSDFNLQDCNGMILVLDFNWTVTSITDGKDINYGYWFYYYGCGEYGDTPVRGDGAIYTDKALNEPKKPELYLCGDADRNGVINVKDATAIQKHLAEIQTCDEAAGNVDFMGGLTVKDATAIQKYVAGIDTGFLIGQYVS